MFLRKLVNEKIKQIHKNRYLKIREELIKLPIGERVIFEYNAKIYRFWLGNDNDEYLEDFLFFFGDEYREALCVVENDVILDSEAVAALLTDEFLNYLLN